MDDTLLVTGGGGESRKVSNGCLGGGARIFNFPRGKPDGGRRIDSVRERGSGHRASPPILGYSRLEYHPLPTTFSLVFNYPRIKENPLPSLRFSLPLPLAIFFLLFSFFFSRRRKREVSSLFDLLRIVSFLNSFFPSPSNSNFRSASLSS